MKNLSEKEKQTMRNEYAQFIEKIKKTPVSPLVGPIFPSIFDDLDFTLIEKMMDDDEEKLKLALKMACLYKGVRYKSFFICLLQPELIRLRSIYVLL